MPKLVPDGVKAKAVSLYVDGCSLSQINSQLGVSGASVTAWVREAGGKVRSRKEGVCRAVAEGRMTMPCRTGVLSNTWKGGRIKNKSTGYILVKAHGHHRANRNGYAPEHVVVAERMIGRPLNEDEVVHHINQIRDDNRPENLQVMTASAHKSLHSKLRWRDKTKPFRRGLKSA